MIALKFLKLGAIRPYPGFAWPSPEGMRPGKWAKAGVLHAWSNGIHARLLRDALGL